ncbi:nucleotide disphospho-sugar-binding domain-containing protein [Amycolatopsis suaedae]|uniref:DUF1205 domain-containing protein n=1 Tax=Amycolatopsis suaedae TaxID=2510978 RepID=A0A4Q7J5Q2_9PSEU|nr:nucleotide disphospho-sugar-binding domain-containing protein [Amycolatopsis suaedae]RZQ61324.1 DUF1205 domain-containing protein [Amycolatopsis suaedae]
MRVLFASWGLPAHYLHMVPLAWAFRAAGHDVRVAAQPPADRAILGTGMTHVPIAPEHDFDAEFAALSKRLRDRQHHRVVSVDGAAELSAAEQDEVFRMRLEPFVGTAVAMAGDLVEAARRWRPDLVIADHMVLAAPLAAHAVDAPLVGHLWGPALLHEMGLPGCDSPVERWPAELVALYDRYGVRPARDHTVATVDNCSAALQRPGIPNRIGMRYVPFNGSGTVPDWLEQPRERPRVCVTWGSTATEKTGPEEFVIPEVLAGLSELDVEVVVAIGKAERELIGEVGPDVRLVEGLPLNLLLPTCDAVVHHGGTGTLLTAGVSAVPQVMVVSMGHYRFNAARVQQTGAGVTVGIEDAVPARIRDEVAGVLAEGEVRAGARALRAGMLAQPAPADVVGTLTALV